MVSQYARPHINIKINGTRFSGLLYTGSDTTILSKHLWLKTWPIEKNLLPNCRNFSKQSIRNLSKYSNLPCEGPEGQPTTLKPYVIDTTLNLTGRDLLMQWQTQMYIPHFS